MWSAQRAVQCFVALLLFRMGPLQAQGWIEPVRPFVAGRRVSFRLGASGRTAWGPGELDRLVQAFRS